MQQSDDDLRRKGMSTLNAEDYVLAPQKVEFKDIGWNVPFMVEDLVNPIRWAVKIDEARFIFIGQNGAHYPEEKMNFYVR